MSDPKKAAAYHTETSSRLTEHAERTHTQYETHTFRERILLATFNALQEGDPIITVSFGPTEIHIEWKTP